MFLQALKTSIPALLCYLPLGIVYGVLCHQAGWDWYYAPLFSFFVLAGAMQFVALSLVSMGAPLLTIVLAIIPLGVRNIFYGMTLLERYRPAPWPLRLYLAHGLVDATFSLLFTHDAYADPKKDLKYATWLTVLIHIYWVVGSLCGSFVVYLVDLPSGLEFSLTAFFTAVAVEQFLKKKDGKAVAIAAASILLSLFVFPAHFFLGCVGLAICLCLVIPVKERVVT